MTADPRHVSLLLRLIPLFLALGLPITATAYTPACYREVKQYCGDVQPGAGRQTDCVAHNQHRFSTLCRPEIHTIIEQRGRFGHRCKADARSLCPGVKPGRGRLYACLKFNEEQLTIACKQQME